MDNILYYGDNLHYLRELPGESVDLIYLDPPFNSQATYNLLFRTPEGSAVEAQTTAFRDTWSWDVPAADAFDHVLASGLPVARTAKAMSDLLGQRSDLLTYLVMMATLFTR